FLSSSQMVSPTSIPTDLKAALAPVISRVSFITPLPILYLLTDLSELPRRTIRQATCSVPAEVEATLEYNPQSLQIAASDRSSSFTSPRARATPRADAPFALELASARLLLTTLLPRLSASAILLAVRPGHFTSTQCTSSTEV